MATVFQAECHGIIHGLEQLVNTPEGEVNILTDNQAVVKSLATLITTTRTVKMLKETLNQLAKTRKITVKMDQSTGSRSLRQRARQTAWQTSKPN